MDQPEDKRETITVNQERAFCGAEILLQCGNTIVY
jgi:hypothetical protein